MSDSKAVTQFKKGYNCAQSVFYSFAERIGIPEDLALRLATGFGAGFGRKQEVCGAVTGSVLVLNTLYGRGEDGTKEKTELNYELVRTFIDRFSEKQGSIYCSKILDGCDLLSEQGKSRFHKENMIELCYRCVDDAVLILEEMIKEVAEDSAE